MTVTEAHAILKKDRPNITMEQAEHELLCFQSIVRLELDDLVLQEFAAQKAKTPQYDLGPKKTQTEKVSA